MLVKVMNILSRSNALLGCVFRARFVFNQTCVFRAVHSLNPPFTPPATPANFSQFYQRKCLSESSQTSHLVSTDGQQEEENSSGGHSTRPAETFDIDVLVSLLRQENAVDMCVINVPGQIKYAQYFIVVSGVSPRHLRAMAFYAIKVYKFLKKEVDPNVTIEGKHADDWMCIDFGTMVVHFLMPETRERYELEKLWTLRHYDEQLKKIPAEILPEDFVLDLEITK